MRYNFQKKEMLNNILFLFFLSLFILFNVFLHLNYEASIIELICLIFLFFGGIVYGYISKNPLKSYLIGFLLFPIMLLFSLIQDSLSFTELLSHLFNIFIVLVYSSFWGLPGYFMAKESNNKKKRLAYVISSILLCFILGFIFMLGIN